MINIILKIWYHFVCSVKFCWVSLLRRDPVIRSFTIYPSVAVSDNPLLISWKVSGSWKVEIEAVGKVKSKDCQVFNNKYTRSHLTILAYGRKRKIVQKSLDLNLKKHPFFLKHGFLQATVSQPVFSIPISALSTSIRTSFQHLSSAFYACQDNRILVSQLSNIISPQHLNVIADALVNDMALYANNQDAYFKIFYDSELTSYLQNKKIKSWTSDPPLTTRSNHRKDFHG